MNVHSNSELPSTTGNHKTPRLQKNILRLLPLELLETIFTLAQNPNLPHASKTFYAVACSPPTQVAWLLHRYKRPSLAAFRGLHWRFFRLQTLLLLENQQSQAASFVSKKLSNAKRLLAPERGEGDPRHSGSPTKRVRFNNVAVDEISRTASPNDRPRQCNGDSIALPADMVPIKYARSSLSSPPPNAITFHTLSLPCWIFSIPAAQQSTGPSDRRDSTLDDPDQHPLSLIIALLKRGMDPDTLQGYPLIKSASLGRVNTVRCLLDAGADVQPFKNRPLLEATKGGHVDVMRALLQRNAKPDALCLKTAIQLDCWEAVDLLTEFGAEPDISVVNAL